MIKPSLCIKGILKALVCNVIHEVLTSRRHLSILKYSALFIFVFFTNYSSGQNNIETHKIIKSDLSVSTNKQLVENYRNDIDKAFSLLETQKKIIYLELNKNERAMIISIAFPEIIRYNSFSDLIETSSNRILYINGGKEVSDFSIGYFQMKPSFIEDLEKYIIHSNNLKKYRTVVISNKIEKKAREERINRLENLQWQLRYLKIFWEVLDDKYQNKLFKSIQDKIRFYATAYNFGFTRSEKMIDQYQNNKAFPNGMYFSRKPACYADFSLDFFNNYTL